MTSHPVGTEQFMAASPASPPLWIACPKCGERLAVRAEDEGKRGRCQKCGEIFRISPPNEATAPPEPKAPADVEPTPSPDFDELPATVSFGCELCQTRLTASTVHVGRKMKCPDCGRANVIPPPPAKRKPNIPAAMSGEQYGLWGVDEAPSPAKQSAAAPRRHPVHCIRCGTLMYARDEHIGKKLKCPDCGALTVAKATAPANRKSVLVELGEEYDIEQPPPRAEILAPKLLSPEEAAIRDVGVIPAVAAAMAAHKARVIEPPKLRPVRPKNPLWSGALRMIFTQELIARWIALSLGLGVVAQLLSETLLSQVGQGFAAAGVSIIMMVMTIFAVVFGAFWFASFGPLIVLIVGESADGNDQLEQPPKLLAFDWFGEAITAGFAFVLGALAGLGAWKVAAFIPGAPLEVRIIAAAMGFVVVFPFAVLSTLLEGSPMGVISPKLLKTLGACAGPWLLFYIETFLLAGIVGLVVWLTAPAASGDSNVGLVWAGAATLVAAMLIDMRLLGRLAWWISDAMPEEEDV